ncbi:MAG: YybH family protein [Gemmatimonadales bacterium]
MSFPHRSTMGVVLLAFLAACQPSIPDVSQADKDAIKATVDKYIAAVLAKDLDSFGKTLMPDVFYSGQNYAPLKGRDAAVAFLNAFPKVTKFTTTIDDVAGHGDLAYERGTYAIDVSLPDATSMTEHGAYLTVFRRQADGSWLYSQLLYHSTDPLPAPAPAKKK